MAEEEAKVDLEEQFRISENSYAETLNDLDQKDNFVISLGTLLVEEYLKSAKAHGEVSDEAYVALTEAIQNVRRKLVDGIEEMKKKNEDD